MDFVNIPYLNNTHPNFYEEIKTYYPTYYFDCEEMEAIWRVWGRFIDGIQGTAVDGKIAEFGALERVLKNCFILGADRETLTKWEQFLDIDSTGLTLEERRGMIIAFLGSNGKISASVLEGLLNKITGGSTKMLFVNKDADENYLLSITFSGGGNITETKWEIIGNLLDLKLPAHLSFEFDLQETAENLMHIGAVITQNMEYTIKQGG